MQIIKTDQKKGDSFKSFFLHLFRDHVFESSAALSYYFLFAFFPLAIFISAVFSTLNISPDTLSYSSRIIPEQILNLFRAYLKEISLGNTWTLMILGSILTVYSMGKAIQTMKRKFRLAYEIDPKLPLLKEWGVSLIFVFLLLLSFFASLILIVAGRSLLVWLAGYFPIVAELYISLQLLRYTVVSAYLGFVLFGVYYILPGIKQRKRDVLPGTLFSLAAWMVMSYLFSFFLGKINDFSTLYGSLGTIIALITWMFLINTVILLGSYINSFFYLKNKETKE